MLFNYQIEVTIQCSKKILLCTTSIVGSALFYIKEYGITICIGMEIQKKYANNDIGT